ncbi:MAG: 4Fe-4S dicluster domain-containing protein [Armatimonadetes bacterium]|nr:4Fe-4S dicluster domain-containing protein [Armatimonadota bacterium]
MASHKVVLHFPLHQLNQPVVNNLIKRYDLDFNILRAEVTPNERGFVVLELTGEEQNFCDGLAWLDTLGVTVQPLSEDVVRLDDRCTHCGACVTSCPVDALYVDRPSQAVIFDQEACIGCGICVDVCPPRAMVVQF